MIVYICSHTSFREHILFKKISVQNHLQEYIYLTFMKSSFRLQHASKLDYL